MVASGGCYFLMLPGQTLRLFYLCHTFRLYGGLGRLMLAFSYGSAYSVFGGLGGMCVLLSLVLVLLYRLAATALAGRLSTAMGAFVLPSAAYVCIYFCYLLPWLTVLYTWRGHEAGLLYTVGCAYQGGLRAQGVILGAGLLAIAVLFVAGQRRLHPRWVFEHFCSCLSLQLCWVLIGQSASVMSALIWLEVASLSALLAITYATVNKQSQLTNFGAWGASKSSQQAQLGFLTSILAFLWASGFAAVLLLLAFCLGLGLGFDLNSWGFILSGPACAASGNLAVEAVFWNAVMLGLLTKLLLQPVQAFLLAFYRRLSLSAIATYLVVYYVFLLPTLLLTFCGTLISISSGWLCGVLVTCGFALSFVLSGAGASVDLRHTLAFSTVVNLCLLLLALTTWA